VAGVAIRLRPTWPELLARPFMSSRRGVSTEPAHRKHGAGALAVFDAALNIDHAARPPGRVGLDLGDEALGADLGPAADRQGQKVTSMLALAPVLQPAWQKPRLVQARAGRSPPEEGLGGRRVRARRGADAERSASALHELAGAFNGSAGRG
jgi:hypothetical protein